MSPNQSQNIGKNSESLQINNDVTFISVLISTFTSVFLAELGDKTQIATLILSAQSGRPFIVFLGAAIALLCISLLGVLLGRWIARKLPREKFNLLAGSLMIVLGALLGRSWNAPGCSWAALGSFLGRSWGALGRP